MSRLIPHALTSLAFVAVYAASAMAAELHFREECRVDGGLVLLSDVADIYDADRDQVERLSKIDLLPAPPAKNKRVLRIREIQDLLHLRGINPNDHRFTGASQVTLHGIADTKAPALKKVGYNNVSLQQITSNVRAAILDYVQDQAGDETEWIVKFDLKPDQSQSLAAAGSSLKIEGGESPWTGPQNLTLSFKSADGVVRVPLTVQITAPSMIVVAARSLARGVLINDADVRLQAGMPTEGATYVYRTFEEVVGKEVARPIAAGQILDSQFIRRPVLVERSDIVTVYARTAGLRVRTTARALETGGDGDLLRVESIADRKSYFARVTGPQEVEVFAHAPTAASDTPPSRRDAMEQQAKYQRRLSPPAPLPLKTKTQVIQ